MSNHPFTEHIPNLRRYSVALMRDRIQADDLVQDTLERALNKYPLFTHGTNLRAWLFTIMHNIFINQVSRNPDRLQAASNTQEHSSTNEQVEEMVVVRDLEQALHLLPEEQRVLILLIGLEQLTYEQAAQVLQLPVGTIMSRLSRARERLQALLNGEHAPHLRRIK